MQGHIRKKGNSWQALVYLGKDAQGKKRYKSRSAKTKKEAQRLLTELIHQINTNTFSDPGKVTFGEYLDKWVQEYCQAKLAPRTLKRYEQIIELHIKPELGKKPLVKLQPIDLQSYYTRALTSGRIGPQDKETPNPGLSSSTVLYHHRVIHRALELAVRWNLLARNVTDGVEPPQKADTDIEVISNENLKKIFEIAKENYPTIYEPLILLAATGTRRAEIIGLLWKDIDFKNNQVHIRRQMQRLDGKLTTRQKTKNKRRRTIDLPLFAIEILKHKYTDQDDNALVFTWPDGRPIDPDYVTKTFKKIVIKLKMNIKTRLHDVRHTFASQLLENNVHPKVVSEILGHSAIGITLDIYSHVVPKLKSDAAHIINEQLFKTPDCPEIARDQNENPPI